MATGDIPDPFGNYNFLVELDGIARAAFQECSGFDSTVDVIEHREGGENTTLRKLPGMAKYSNIVLKWGITDDRELYDWHRDIVRGEIVRAWPTKYDGPDLNAEGNDVAIEMLELAHEGVSRV